jgi:NADH-quinone oxidoreductase chain G
MKYFYINNIKFNYTIEFMTNSKKDLWKQKAPLIEYCETLGVDIPHFCYHKNLSISGNCRMCLIELKKSPKPIVSCAMSAKSSLNNGEIFTNSPLVKKARENILEFLLLNHPLDCPICDQGGECDLQDQSFSFGLSKKRFYNYKRIVSDKNIGPIVKTVMTRCIHCTRCVRFASEVVDNENLGVFGRGLQSEIGTYVTKVFSSELSGNVIDLCPVGALTSKQYPFVQRNWELKSVKSIDFLDGFGENIQVYLKNNKIVKILSGYNTKTKSITWITDKTRFSFDGMFSPERITQGFINTNNKVLSSTWKLLFNEIVLFLYFQDHLNKHFLTLNSLVIVFSSKLSLEVLNLLTLLARKYSFFSLRKLEPFNLNLDLEQKFKLDLNLKPLNLERSDLCLLLSVNTRYESPSLNLKLRQRFLKGNFKILSLGSLVDLKYPISYLGMNPKILKSVAEGNNFFCQELITYSKPIILSSSELYHRKDSNSLFSFIETLQNNINLTNNTVCTNQIVSTSLNDFGVNHLNLFKSVSESDLQNSSGFFFVSANFIASNLRKIVEFKLLNYFQDETLAPKFVVDQNETSNNSFYQKLKKSYNIYSYIFLPTKVFFETNGTYLNTEGIFKKATSIISSEKQPKESWHIIRKLFSYTKTISFLSEFKNNSRIIFNCKNIRTFQSFIGFQHYAIKSLTNISFWHNKTHKNLKLQGSNQKFLNKPTKTFQTKMHYWVDDFYLKGKDVSSRFSAVNIKLSQVLLKSSTNFI